MNNLTKTPGPVCDCIKKANDFIAEFNSIVNIDLISGAVVIETIKKNDNGIRRMKKPPYLFCSFCPMCGIKYQ